MNVTQPQSNRIAVQTAVALYFLTTTHMDESNVQTPIEGEIVEPGTIKTPKGISANPTETATAPVQGKKPRTKKAGIPGKTEEATKEPSPGEMALTFWEGYLDKNVVNEFSKVPTFAKLTMLQYVDQRFIKTREVANVKIPYVTHEFAEKALNFAFNFNVDAEVIKAESKPGSYERSVKQSDGTYKKATTKYLEVTLQVKFTFYDKDTERQIVRTVFSGHKGYESPATTEADVFKSALSKAYTIVARTFGIAGNVKDATVKDAKEGWKKARSGKPAQPATPAPPPESVSMADLEEEAYSEIEHAPAERVGQVQPKSWED